MSKRVLKFKEKLMILGFDGLSPVIMREMIKSDELPNFSKLQRQGAFMNLASTNPSQSPVAWTGFATGKNPGKSRVFDFIERNPVNYSLNLSLSKMEKGRPSPVRRAKAFWEYSSQAGVPTTIITCPITYPPDKLKGKMLSGMGVPDILGTEGTFTFYTSEALDRSKPIGGKVFQVKPTAIKLLNLIGPRRAGKSNKVDNLSVPLIVKLGKSKEEVTALYQNKKVILKVGQWSDWQEVFFKLGSFKRAKGIFKFYLQEVQPEFKLYISPVNFDPRDPLFPISFPKNYSKELAKKTGLYYTQGMPMDTWAVNEKRLLEKPFLEQASEVLREKKSMLDYELSRFKRGILYCYFESSDIIQHMFWRYTDSLHPLFEAGAPQEYKQVIRDWYKKMDNILGEVMRELSKEDYLFVISDHGFDTFRRAVHINSWLRQNGYLALKDDKAEEGTELLLDVDWSRTKAYAIGFGAVYINQKGREGQGIVDPGEETEVLKKEIVKKMASWIDLKYDQPVVSKVYPREEIFSGEYLNETPDLYVGFNIGYRASWQTALGAAPKVLIEDNLKKWSGSHLFDPALVPGVIFSNRKITKVSPALYDLAPTILKIIGYSPRDISGLDFDGAPLF